MTLQGFQDYLYAVYERKNGTANSYIMAINIIDNLFKNNDVFGLEGKSVASIDDYGLLTRIAIFVCDEQRKYKKGGISFFSNVNSNQSSYPCKGFCSASINQLLKYYTYCLAENKGYDIANGNASGRSVSGELAKLFKLDKKGSEKVVAARIRIGQGYFRNMILKNYGYQCCVTRLNVPVILRASHISEWSKDKANRLNPENGLCLSATYDAAFDKHLISFDEDYRMIVSKSIQYYYTNDAAREYFQKFEGKQIILPSIFIPSKKLLEKHRAMMVG